MKDKEEIKNKVGNFYGNIHKDGGQIDSCHTSNFLYRFQEKPTFFHGKKALDAGCGFGRASYAMANARANVTAIDISDQGLRLTKNNCSGLNVKVMKADILNLPFKDNTFDIVNCSGVIHHTTDPIRAFDECVRVLKKGGVMLIAVYGRGWQNKTIKFLNRFFSKRDYDPTKKFFELVLPEWFCILMRVPPPSKPRAIKLILDLLHVPIMHTFSNKQLKKCINKECNIICRTPHEIFSKGIFRLFFHDHWLQYKIVKR
jgi:SAM-dependent methyltransferase